MKNLTNQNGFTYILALTVVVIMGIMLGMIGQSWQTIKQREQEKELLFRGSQIKEAIENWYNPQFKPVQMPHNRTPRPLMDLKELLKDEKMPQAFRFIPQFYEFEVDDKNPKCAPDCAKLKIYQDPMTGKEWTVIRGSYTVQNGAVPAPPGSQSGGIIGVASKSDETPFRTDFKNTALENMGTIAIAAAPAGVGTVPQVVVPAVTAAGTTAPLTPGSGGKMTKYSQWQFIAESAQKNDHTKIYRAYHEGW
ncbi:MAG TPA: type II secretion system protein [Desulfuromonadales bacterium]|nr:type II secretion system protein [Desulfuromonadales bacterium]